MTHQVPWTLSHYEVTGAVSRDAYPIVLYRGNNKSAADREYENAKKKYAVARSFQVFTNGVRSHESTYR